MDFKTSLLSKFDKNKCKSVKLFSSLLILIIKFKIFCIEVVISRHSIIITNCVVVGMLFFTS